MNTDLVFDAFAGNRWAQEAIERAELPKPLTVVIVKKIVRVDNEFRDGDKPFKVRCQTSLDAHTALIAEIQAHQTEAGSQPHVVSAVVELEKVRTALTSLISGVEPPPKVGKATSATKPLPPVGTELIHGELKAKVVETGVEFNGQVFGSMTAAALAALQSAGTPVKSISGWAFWQIVSGSSSPPTE